MKKTISSHKTVSFKANEMTQQVWACKVERDNWFLQVVYDLHMHCGTLMLTHIHSFTRGNKSNSSNNKNNDQRIPVSSKAWGYGEQAIDRRPKEQWVTSVWFPFPGEWRGQRDRDTKWQKEEGTCNHSREDTKIIPAWSALIKLFTNLCLIPSLTKCREQFNWIMVFVSLFITTLHDKVCSSLWGESSPQSMNKTTWCRVEDQIKGLNSLN